MSNKLATTINQRDELGLLLKSISEQEDFASERKLIEQIAKLEAEVIRLQKENNVSRRIIDSTRNINERFSKKKIEIPAEKKITRESLSTDTLFKKEEPAETERRRSMLEEIFSSGGKEKLFEHIAQEFENLNLKSRSEFDSLAKEVQAELEESEKKLAAAIELQVQAEDNASALSAENKQLKAEINNLNRQISGLLKAVEDAGAQKTELEEKNRELFEQGEKTRRGLVEKLREDLKDQETRNAEAEQIIEKLSREKIDMSIRLRQLESLNKNSEKVSVQTENQVEDLQRRLGTLSEEHDRLKVRYTSLLRDKEKLTNDLTESYEKLELLRREHMDATDALQVKFNAKIKQYEERSIPKIPSMRASGTLNASLFNSELAGKLNQIEEPLENFGPSFMLGMSDIPQPKVIDNQELEGEPDIQMLEELQEKNLQLKALREQVVELKSKLAAGSSRDIGKKEIEISRLHLEVKHLEQTFADAKSAWSKEKAAIEKNYEDLYVDYVEYKLSAASKLLERDRREEVHRKNNKLLKMKIDLYEKQITEYNIQIEKE